MSAEDLLAFLDSDESITEKFDHTKIKFNEIKIPWKPTKKSEEKKEEL